MFEWIKKHYTSLIMLLVTAGMLFFIYACEPKVKSLTEPDVMVTRAELQLELDQLLMTAQIRMADLDRQNQIRSIIMQNALLIVEGQPFNPFGLLTAVAALYGLTTAGTKVSKTVKNGINKRKVNNGTG